MSEKSKKRYLLEAKPCPWCHTRDFEFAESVAAGTVAVLCKGCYCHGPATRSEKDAVIRWNRREN